MEREDYPEERTPDNTWSRWRELSSTSELSPAQREYPEWNVWRISINGQYFSPQIAPLPLFWDEWVPASRRTCCGLLGWRSTQIEEDDSDTCSPSGQPLPHVCPSLAWPWWSEQWLLPSVLVSLLWCTGTHWQILDILSQYACSLRYWIQSYYS